MTETEITQPSTLAEEPPDGALVAKVARGGEVLAVLQRDDGAAAENATDGDDPDEHWFPIPDDIGNPGPWTWDELAEDLVGFECLIRLYRESEVSR